MPNNESSSSSEPIAFNFAISAPVTDLNDWSINLIESWAIFGIKLFMIICGINLSGCDTILSASSSSSKTISPISKKSDNSSNPRTFCFIFLKYAPISNPPSDKKIFSLYFVFLALSSSFFSSLLLVSPFWYSIICLDNSNCSPKNDIPAVINLFSFSVLNAIILDRLLLIADNVPKSIVLNSVVFNLFWISNVFCWAANPWIDSTVATPAVILLLATALATGATFGDWLMWFWTTFTLVSPVSLSSSVNSMSPSSEKSSPKSKSSSSNDPNISSSIIVSYLDVIAFSLSWL